MTYAELLARLLGARRYGMVFGLERIRALLDALGAPDARLGTVVHVGGTNGKGSTVAMIAALCRAAGKRVATYTSPHLSSLRERIAFDGVPIGETALCEAAERVRACGGDALTFFEQLTAIACVAIADAGVDVTVLEVGLGGRLDATNAIAAPVAVVTGVAMDHEAILGSTLDAIAAEKAGIFKPGQRVVIGASGEPAAVPRLVARAREVAAAVTVVDAEAIARVPMLGLPGAHQRRNAAAAIAAVEHLGIPVVAGTLAKIVHPGRYEVIEGPPRIILDGAHNPHGAAALADTLRERNERPITILAVSSDKDVRGIVAALAPLATAIVATRYRQERALDPHAIADIARACVPRAAPRPPSEGVGASADEPPLLVDHPTATDVEGRTRVHVHVAPDLATADALARELATRARVSMLIAGSLFLVGEARVRYLGAPADPVPVGDPHDASHGDVLHR